MSVEEVLTAIEEGRLEDGFGTGTAVTIHDIISIGLDGKDYELPNLEGREFSTRVSEYLYNLKLGKAEDYMGWMEKV